MLMLYLSRGRIDRKNAKGELTKNAEKLKSSEWPYAIVELFLDKEAVKAVESKASNDDQRCEAQFYIGEWYLLRRELGPAEKAFKRSADLCSKDFVEYQGAVVELKRLKQ